MGVMRASGDREELRVLCHPWLAAESQAGASGQTMTCRCPREQLSLWGPAAIRGQTPRVHQTALLSTTVALSTDPESL